MQVWEGEKPLKSKGGISTELYQELPFQEVLLY